ncbi:PREDICTED: SPARC-like protein 1 [Elephantulus edwardii]|uniref:SPARC-like protein 1 n=1 Tax=Elephantulus edwardii TaxID=28737 RepID=UPI0003F0E514|nr:PREDICTED: SPARC-like protein 1 [Elephantulus edwardii]
MKTVIFFLFILGVAAAVPTTTRFLSDHSKPTADSLSSIQHSETSATPHNTAIPTLEIEYAENEKEPSIYVEDYEYFFSFKDEKSSILTSKEESHEQAEDHDQNSSKETGQKDQEDRDGDLGVGLEDKPTEGTLNLNEDTTGHQKKNLSENTDFHDPDVSSTVDYKQQQNLTEKERNQDDQVNKSSKLIEDLSDQENQEQDPTIPKQEEEKETVGAQDESQESEEEKEELSKGQFSSNQENSTQLDDVLEESSQPTQVSMTQKAESEQGNQEQDGEDHFKEEMEEESASKINKHGQDTEWQGQEGKTGHEIITAHKEMEKKTVPEALFMEPIGNGNSMPQNQEAGAGEESPGHNAGDEGFSPSQPFLENDRAQSNYYPINNEEPKERVNENESVDSNGPRESQEVKKIESLPNEDENSSEGNMRVEDACMTFQCKRGHVCKADAQGKPRCVCQDPVTCPPTKLLDQVCGTDNQTYASSCHLFATKCKLEGTKKGHQLQLDYFGACKSIPACTDFEVTQFPLRMRDWLKNILIQLYEHNPEHAGYLNEKQRSKVKKIYLDEKRLLAGDHPIDLLLRDFKKNYHMYVYPVHWQFSELDQHPMDRILTHSELAPLRASLVPMEHCITRFFEECDPNKDKHITLKEWGHCFGIKEGKLIISPGKELTSSPD